MKTKPQQVAHGADSKSLVHVFPDSEAFGKQFADAPGFAQKPVELHHFPDGETLVHVHAPPGRHAMLVRSLHHPNTKLVEILLAADALRRAGAHKVTLVAPYLPYMRQDAVFALGEPISQYVIGDFHRAFDRVLTLEAHLHRTMQLSDVILPRAKSHSAAPAIACWVQETGSPALIVGPDAESEPWIRPELPRGIEPNAVLLASLSDNLKDAIQAYEKTHIEHVLTKMAGDKKAAAEALGMSLSSLYRRVKSLSSCNLA